jgi:fumarate reductase subunit C
VSAPVLSARLYVAQRLSAVVMAPLVILHLMVIIVAVRNGLSAEEILGRTRGSILFGTTYAVFVVAAAVHGAIGVRTIVAEAGILRGRALSVLGFAIFAGLAGLGLRAVIAVTLP